MTMNIISTAYKIGLDLETTGLSLFEARFVQLGASIWKFDVIEKTFLPLATFIMSCRSDVPMEPKSIQITGITQEFVDRQVYTARDVLEKFLQFLNLHCEDQMPRALVGYNINDFDIPFIIFEAERSGLGGMNYFQGLKLNSSMDLLPICRDKLETLKLERKSDGCAVYKLGSVYKALLGKPLKDAHNALVDAVGAIEVLQAGYSSFFEAYVHAAISDKPKSFNMVGVVSHIDLVKLNLLKWHERKGIRSGKKNRASQTQDCMSLLKKAVKIQQEKQTLTPPPLEPL
jgi:DNA polymerase III epsilon subunit-like protein